uniref:Uncharacterized protein LOC100371202 n=1 Tax=Saccoglossus kowalevskii TaxID=10224 RepID=A0ABM0M148_SACKO|nr:PREDICTED: uncharacterized protein LOC100371202 [Saccoglossus kowalevskii]
MKVWTVFKPHAIQKIQVACVQLIDSLSKLISLLPQNRSHVSQRLKFEYDVFLSYSHKNSNKASLLLNGLLEVDSSLKIFFDTEELKTVCDLKKDKNLLDNEHQLIPVCIDDITEPPLEFTKVPMLDYRNMKTQEDVQDLCHQVVAMLQHPDTMKTELLKKQSVIDMSLTDIDLLADDYQQLDFSRKYGSTSKASLRQTALSCKMLTTTENEDDGDKQKCDIAISFAVADMKYARYLTTLLKQNAPQLIVNDTMSSDHTQISVLETANKVVCLLTANYIESPSQCEEFHIALFRHRANPASPVLFPIQISALPKKPTYFHLVPYELNCTSPLWKKIIVEMGLTETLEEFRKNVGRTLAERVTKEEAMALYKGTEAILLTMKAESEKSASSHLTQSIILHNIHYMRFMIMKMKNSEYTEDVQQYLYKLSVTEGEPNAATKQKQPGVKTKTKNISPKKDKTTSSGKVTSKVKDNQEDVTIETVSRQSHACCII